MPDSIAPTQKPGLVRSLSLIHVVLYGLGVTVGAGIYVLVDEVIAGAGNHAPLAFLIAGFVMLFPAACFAELTGRMPFAAAEAHFVRSGFNSPHLFRIVGPGVALVGIISSAAIAHGAVGYIAQLAPLSEPVLLVIVILASGCIASLGVKSSILFAGLLTLIEVGGLLALIFGALASGADLSTQAKLAIPTSFAPELWAGIFGSGLLAFFAFIGFEDIDSIAEETKDPQRTLARGIFLTLGLTLVLYIGVILAALASVPMADLTYSQAPLALVFDRATGWPPEAIILIAIIATVNGIIVQLIMAGRVLYGLARQDAIPAFLGLVNTSNHAPVSATLFSTGITLLLALAFPILALAQWTSGVTLAVFILVCAALTRIKARGDVAPANTFVTYTWVPYAGVLACAALLLSGLL